MPRPDGSAAVFASVVFAALAQSLIVAVLVLATDSLHYTRVTDWLRWLAVANSVGLTVCYFTIFNVPPKRWYPWRKFAFVFTAATTASLLSMLHNAHPPVSVNGADISITSGVHASFCNWCPAPRMLAGLIVLTIALFMWATSTAEERPAYLVWFRCAQVAVGLAQLVSGAALVSMFDSPSCYTLTENWDCRQSTDELANAWRKLCLGATEVGRCVEMRAVLLHAREALESATYIFLLPCFLMACVRAQTAEPSSGHRSLGPLLVVANVYAVIFFGRGAGLLLFTVEHYGSHCTANNCTELWHDDMQCLEHKLNERVFAAGVCASLALVSAAMAVDPFSRAEAA